MKNKKILICDDDKGVLETLQIAFKEEGFQVIAENSSVDVLKVAEKELPDLLVIDIFMPVASGNQILKRLKANPAISNIPVLMCSASNDGKQKAINAGADAFAAKPFNMDQLMSSVKSLLQLEPNEASD